MLPEARAPAGPLAGAYAALDAYQPPLVTPEILQALTSGIGGWLSGGGDPALLPGLLRTFPKLQATHPAVDQADLNGDGTEDVVVQTDLMGLPVLTFLRRAEGRYLGLTLPPMFDEPLPTLRSGFLSSDLTGDGRPETVVTYTVPGGSMSTELLYVFHWSEMSPTLVFRADLITWAGPSPWALEPDPTAPGRQQLLLTYPHFYRDGFDHKMVNHPLGWQVWRWDENAGRFVQAEKGVDLERSGWGPEASVTMGDRLLWLINEAETAFRAGNYEAALEGYERASATARDWSRGANEPDWAGLIRFRRGEILLLLGRSDEARAELHALADEYANDLLGELAAACLSGAEEDSPDAPARCIAAMQQIQLWYRMDEHCGGGALCFPLYSTDILYPPAGLTAYLNAHPELPGDSEAIRTGLEAVGFALDEVRQADGGSLWLIVQAGGIPTEWTLVRDADGRWRPYQPPACSPPRPCWPRVGNFEE
ncbi:MAG: tetratricopeptide repeat protein [Thermoflexales bacterium]|nr:tetratricopeptide repeat protein [Thermoflexales bacterium]